MTDSTTRLDRVPAVYDPTTEGYDHRMEAARVALLSGDRPAAEQALEAAIAIAERTPDGSAALAAALSRLGEIRHLDGKEGDAEALFRRALDINERLLGAEHHDLVVLLNDLSRLYLKRGAHADAEPLLLRLHAIKRMKGEDHPEVATVLASLASVKQALGRYDAAEQLWRRVLEIRERTLAPHHFSIATALEHLGETCAARGKLNEALRHRLRALAMREMTLDPGHPSLRTARERIADLQLQASEEVLDVDAPDARQQPPLWIPPVAAAPLSPVSPAPAAAREIAKPDVAPPAAVSSRPSAPLTRTYQQYTPPPAAPAPQPLAARSGAERAPAPALLADEDLDDDDPRDRDGTESGGLHLVNVAGAGDTSRSVIMPYYADVVAIAEAAGEEELAGRSTNGFVSATVAFLRNRQAAIIASVGVGALILGTVAAQSFAGSSETEGAEEPDGFRRVAASGVVAEDAGAVADSTTLTGPQGDALSATDASTERRSASARVPDEAAASPAPSRATNDGARSAITPSLPAAGPVPRTVNVKVDPLQSVAPATRETLSAKVSLPTAGPLRSISTGGDTESQPALLIVAPTPVYPVSLYNKAVAGSASVEFVVDTNGRVDLSTFRSQSNHELFTEAVRHIMQDMRFVPSTSNGRKVRTPMKMRFEFSKSGVSSSRQK